jgi:hypothetical protein
MGFLNELGVPDGSIPSIDITGWASSSWIYIGIIIFFGIIFIGALAFFLFFLTYRKKVILFENISGQGYQPVLKTRARVLKLGVSGEELLKTLYGGHFCSSYGRKMGKNTYWYAKGQDGYWYNIVLGDLDAKRGMLDIEPIDRDVRMFHVALDRLSHDNYGKKSNVEKIIMYTTIFLFLITLILGMWFIVGKIGDAVAPLAESSKMAMAIQETNVKITNQLDTIARNLGLRTSEVVVDGGSGIVPAS